MDMADVMAEIHHLAGTRKHHLAAHMLQASLHPAQARAVLRNLRGCPPVAETISHEFPIERPTATQAELPLPAASAPPPLSAFKHIPAGYYATPRPGTETIDYWVVEKGKGGKWAGASFARRVLGGQSSNARRLRSERLENVPQRVAMQKIVEYGLEEAQILFADTLVRCMDCSSPLTDATSRKTRKGPVCRNKNR
jgi:hypothetical protein